MANKSENLQTGKQRRQEFCLAVWLPLRNGHSVDPIWTPCEHANLAQAREVARALHLPECLAPLLCRLELLDASAAERFLYPKLKTLSDPFLLPQMDAAVRRIHAAIERREKIVLYGDYDVDGVTSLAMLRRMLAAYGNDAACFLPSRVDEGYGLSAEGLERCLGAYSPSLLIAVDCGTSSVREIADLQAAGIDVVVLDHHEGKETRPDCVAVVNPKFGDDFGWLCSAGIVFKVCHALLKMRPLPGFDLKDFLDLAALGTVADLVPLTGENRLLVRHGLERLANTRWVGLQALKEVAAVGTPVRAVDVGYRLGPRLNAAGRLGTAQDALDLLLCDDPAEARRLATGLNAQNTERQTIERQTHLEAERMLETAFQPGVDHALVVGSRNWNSGVVGIVASRLARRFHRPALVVAFNENGLGKGSGRSVSGLSLVQALGECAEFLEKYGGHEMAAGLTIREEHFPAFTQRFQEVAATMLAGKDLQPRLHLDGLAELDALDETMLDFHGLFEPFGMGNAQPVFWLRRVFTTDAPRVMKEKHLRFDLRQNGAIRQAIFFNGATNPLPPPPWDVAFQIEANTFRGETRLQIQVQAIRASQ